MYGCVARRRKQRKMRRLEKVILCMTFFAQRSGIFGFVSQASVAAPCMQGRPTRSIDDLLIQFAEQDEQSENDMQEAKDGFDGEGFAGYLAPYALALLASVAITATFFKFVLLDY
jgi:hypothetical protein